ncbi:uncharacterized protein L969DRAFT_58044 [Mixia osmundae IAM 14324]|uniref:Thioredoxin domain-containing protein n=1 Tax=Mixia osmundae (strain CBS 9802 / IAM 14324 / JCM 22182 / KY 12970) TaxID=764103 RepID=G7DXL6_MIXOS|nr:uncharacterized protein L969DRAFT_58044 [Mixia osmundae IAM 14324]KEI41180.1 hypothetical protein L969DRAFT_58044 [Mixia osmundae IAM 14324]GAA95326.1 hypothetical protein E5Q_01983 [Mixia osmundae IAM 14324]
MGFIELEEASDSVYRLTEALKNYPQACYVLFLSSRDATTQEMWCGDCTEAWPILQAAFNVGPEKDCLIVWAGSKREWKDEANPLRALPLSLTEIPTLIKLRAVTHSGSDSLASRIGGRLGEHDCKKVEEVIAFLS